MIARLALDRPLAGVGWCMAEALDKVAGQLVGSRQKAPVLGAGLVAVGADFAAACTLI